MLLWLVTNRPYSYNDKLLMDEEANVNADRLMGHQIGLPILGLRTHPRPYIRERNTQSRSLAQNQCRVSSDASGLWMLTQAASDRG